MSESDELEQLIIAGNEAQAGPDPLADTSPEPPNEDEILAEQEEVPPPSTVHSSAAAGTSPEDEAIVKGRTEYGEYFIGMWGELPNFGCPYCPFSVVGNSSAPEAGNGETELHILSSIDSGEPRHMAALQLKGE